MELRHLRYFAAVASHGSFQRAAGHLHVTPPALSRQVKDLEDELGVLLFQRGKNLITLTPPGEIFYDEATAVLARADEAVRRVKGEDKSERLRVGYVPSLIASLMPRVLERFQLEHPRSRLELLDLSPGEMSTRVSAGLLDLAVMPAGLEASAPEFVWTELKRLAPVLVMSKAHPLATLKKIRPERLRRLPLRGLARTNFPEYLPRLKVILKPFGFPPYLVDQTADGLSTLFAGLEAHKQAAVLTEGIASVLPATLIMRPFSPALPPTIVKLGTREVRPGPLATRLAQLLQEEAARELRT